MQKELKTFTINYTQSNGKGKILPRAIALRGYDAEEVEENFKSTYMVAYPDIELMSIEPQISLF